MPDTPEPPPHPAESALCLACGMCCDNTMFGRVIVDEGEAKRLHAARITINTYEDGELSFNQPCSALCDKACSIYQARPWTCVSYVCEMLKELRAGTIDEHEAARRITEVQAARAAVAQQAGDADLFDYRNAITDALEAGEDPASLPGCTAELVRLESLLNQWFRTHDYAKTVPAQAS